jgi:cytochrome b
MRLPSQCKIGPCFLYLQQCCLIAHLQKQVDHDQNVCKLAKEQEEKTLREIHNQIIDLTKASQHGAKH